VSTPIGNKIIGHLAAFSANIIFGFTIVITKSLISSWMTPLGHTITRMGITFLVFLVIGVIKRSEKISPKDMRILLIVGALQMGAVQLLFALGITFTTPVVWSIIISTGPIAVLLASAIFLHEKITSIKLTGVILGISGAILIILRNDNSGSNSIWGVVMAILCVLISPIYLISIKKVLEKYDPLTMMKWMCLSAVIILSPFCVSELSSQKIFSAETAKLAILQMGFTVVFSSVIGMLLQPIALKYISPTTMSMYSSLMPIVATATAIIVGQDIFTWSMPTALLLVISGLYLVAKTTQ
jgi:drug/metabolite transporter (DMT)-like permease